MRSEAVSTLRQVTLGEILRLRRERATEKEALLSVTQSRGVIRQEDVGRRDSSSEDKTGYWRVYPGDVVYNTMRMWQGISGSSAYSGIVSPAYTVCKPTADADPRFMSYLLRHPKLVAVFYRYSQGLVSDTWNLKYSTFAKIKTMLPRLPEQRRIAEILGDLDRMIDSGDRVARKSKVFRHGVLRQLFADLADPARPATDFLASSPRNGFSPREVESWSGTLALGLGCLTVDGFLPRQLKNVPLADGRYSGAWLSDGDLLMSRSNTLEMVGLVGRYRNVGAPCIYPDLMMKLVANARVRPEFLELALMDLEARHQIQRLAQGTSGTMVKISADTVRRLRIKVPGIPEQDRIISISKATMAPILGRERETAKLLALKRGLMDDLLSGRVRVSAE